MADPFVAEIRIFAGTFAPKGWAFCGGQLLPISQNTALFSLLGTIYGGDGKSNFALPDLQGRTPLHSDNQTTFQGQVGGTDNVTLLLSEIANHGHNVNVNQVTIGNLTEPSPTTMISTARGGNAYVAAVQPADRVQMQNQAITPGGDDQPHSNLQPYLTVNYIIALQGVFPPRRSARGLRGAGEPARRTAAEIAPPSAPRSPANGARSRADGGRRARS